MTMHDGTRPFLEKIANDNREYVQALLDENQRLAALLAEMEVERNLMRRTLANAQAELENRDKSETALKDRLASVEEERRSFSDRYVEVERQNSSLANLYVATYQLNGTVDRARVVAAIEEIVINLVGSEELAIWELDDGESSALSLVASFGLEANEWAGVPLGNGVVGQVAQSGDRFIASESLCKPTGREENLTACIPLKLDDRVVGVIGVFRLLPQKEALAPVDFELFDLLASHGASALFCTRLFERYVAATSS